MKRKHVSSAVFYLVVAGMALIVLFGTLIGLIGSLVSVGRHLRHV